MRLLQAFRRGTMNSKIWFRGINLSCQGADLIQAPLVHRAALTSPPHTGAIIRRNTKSSFTHPPGCMVCPVACVALAKLRASELDERGERVEQLRCSSGACQWEMLLLHKRKAVVGYSSGHGAGGNRVQCPAESCDERHQARLFCTAPWQGKKVCSSIFARSRLLNDEEMAETHEENIIRYIGLRPRNLGAAKLFILDWHRKKRYENGIIRQRADLRNKKQVITEGRKFRVEVDLWLRRLKE